jgi:hypothetical protein
MSVLSNAAYIADTPDAYFRGLLAGKPGQRATGREVLRLGPNRPGLDAGDIPGFLAEVLLSPTNLVGGWAVKGLAKALGRQMGARQAASAAAKLRRPAAVAQDAPMPLASRITSYADAPRGTGKRHAASLIDDEVVNLTPADRKVIYTMKRAGMDLGRHYDAKWDPIAQNVINPESGLRLFEQPGVKSYNRLRRMMNRNVEVGPGASWDALGDYTPEFVVPTRVGTKTFDMPMGGNIRYNEKMIHKYPSRDVRDLGTHEFAHYLTNANLLMHPELTLRLLRVAKGAHRVRGGALLRQISKGQRSRNLDLSLTPQRVKYLSDPTEMVARVATTRMASEGLPQQALNILLQSPEAAGTISANTRDLVEAFGPRLTKYLLRVVPTIPLAAAMGVGMRENRQAV